MNPNINLILASGSSRRKELMKNEGWEFQVVVPDDSIEAAISHELAPEKFVEVASFRKAESVAIDLDDGVVIAADTIAVCRGEKLGKPTDRSHAREMLCSLSGTEHHVLTGVTVWNVTNGKNVTHVESTLLRMEKLPDSKIEEHLDSGQWEGKAGAFGFQDNLSWIAIVEGLESNVVGLPVEMLSSFVDQVNS